VHDIKCKNVFAFEGYKLRLRSKIANLRELSLQRSLCTDCSIGSFYKWKMGMPSLASVPEDILLLRLSHYPSLQMLSSTKAIVFNSRVYSILDANNALGLKPRRKYREVLRHHLGCCYWPTIKMQLRQVEIFMCGLTFLLVLETDFSHTLLHSGSLGKIDAYRSGP